MLVGGAAVVGGLAVSVLAERQGWWTSAIVGSPDPSGAIERVARRGEAALIAAYQEALANPTLADAGNIARLRSYRDQHREHLAALGGDESDVESAPLPGQPDPDDPQASASVPPMPGDAAAIPAYFAGIEQQRAELLSTGVRISPDGGLARLIALIVASESAHAAGWSRG
jgi:hypothetical protein